MYWSTTGGVAEQRLNPLFAGGESPRFHNRSFPRLTTFINGAPSSHHPLNHLYQRLKPIKSSFSLSWKGETSKEIPSFQLFSSSAEAQAGSSIVQYIVTIKGLVYNRTLQCSQCAYNNNGDDAVHPFGLDNFEMITSIWKSVANDQSKPEAQEDLWEQPLCQSN